VTYDVTEPINCHIIIVIIPSFSCQVFAINLCHRNLFVAVFMCAVYDMNCNSRAMIHVLF